MVGAPVDGTTDISKRTLARARSLSLLRPARMFSRTFSFYYNFVRERSELGFPPSLYDSPLKDRSEADRFISLVQEAIQ